MSLWTLPLIAALALAGCGDPPAPPEPAPQPAPRPEPEPAPEPEPPTPREQLFARLTQTMRGEPFKRAVMLAMKATGGKPVPPQSSRYAFPCRVLPIRAEGARDQLLDLAPKLAEHGASLYRFEHRFDVHDAAVLLPTTDPLTAVEVVGPSGWGLRTPDGTPITTELLLGWLRELRAKHPFTLIGVGPELIELVLDAAPDQGAARAIAARAAELAPYSTEAAGGVDGLAKRLRDDRYLLLSWDAD